MRGDPDLKRPGDRLLLATVLSLTLAVAGCSGASLFGSSAPSTPATSPSLTDKFSNFFSSSTATSQQSVAGAPQEVECPLINIRQGASTFTVGPGRASVESGSTDNGAMAVKYQGSFVRAARECELVSGNVVMKIGVEGRIVVGPAGGPGEVTVPLRIAVVDETPNKTRPIVSRFVQIPVTVASASDNPTFTHIEEGVSFPMSSNLDRYLVYIGFDPLAAQPPPKPAAKPKPKAKPKPG
jgi:hypothetical protein